jgi:hypothetical protein
MFKVLERLFGCRHKNRSFPRSARPGQRSPASPAVYVVCLDCGKEFPYDWDKMKIVSAPKPVKSTTGTSIFGR